MTAIQKIELERQNTVGTRVHKDDVKLPETGGDAAQTEHETESEQERQARESEKAFDQAITRLPPG